MYGNFLTPITAVATTSCWSIFAADNPEMSPAGGQYTIVGCLVVAIIWLVKELKKERERSDEHRSDMTNLLKSIIDEKRKEAKEAWHRVDEAEKHDS